MTDRVFTKSKCAACGKHFSKQNKRSSMGAFTPLERGLPLAPYYLCKKCSKQMAFNMQTQQAITGAVERRYYELIKHDKLRTH